jgi:hypothetical protein
MRFWWPKTTNRKPPPKNRSRIWISTERTKNLVLVPRQFHQLRGVSHRLKRDSRPFQGG